MSVSLALVLVLFAVSASLAIVFVVIQLLPLRAPRHFQPVGRLTATTGIYIGRLLSDSNVIVRASLVRGRRAG